MSNTRYLEFTGNCTYAKVYDFQKDKKYDKWDINVYLDDEELANYMASGIQVEVKEDDLGKYVRFRRDETKLINKEVVKFGPPEVIGPDRQPFEESIGNGSRVCVTVEVFPSKKGFGHRLRRVQVLEHVPYIPKPKDGSDDLPPPKGAVATKSDMDDEIPF